VVGEKSSLPPASVAVGEAIDVANELRKAAASTARHSDSQHVYTGGRPWRRPPRTRSYAVRGGSDAPISWWFSPRRPRRGLVPDMVGREANQSAALQRLWSGLIERSDVSGASNRRLTLTLEDARKRDVV